MRVWLDPDKLANLGVTAVDVENAIAEQNVQVAAGKIGQSPAPPGTPFELQVNAAGPALRPRRILEHHRSRRSGGRRRRSACATSRASSSARCNIRRPPISTRIRSVVLGVFQMPGIERARPERRVKDKMEELATRFPHGIAYAMHYDTTRFVSAAMRDVVVTLVEALALVIFVVFVFLQSWRATIIPTIAIPVSLIATLAVMEVFGFSLNMLSLLGMVLAIGLVVDDAIVVVENVERQLEAGLPPLAAAKKAMAEVTGPIIATTAVLMAVFVPVAFIPGVAGRLYNQFALTVAISVGISAFNSLTLSPALSAAMLRHAPKGSSFVFRWFNAGLRLAVARLCAFGQAVHPLRLGAGRRVRAARRRRLWPVARDSDDLPAGRGPGLFLRHRPVAGRRLAPAHRRGRAAGARHSAGDARRRDRRLHQRAQLSDQRGAVEFGGRVRDPEAVGRARAGRERLEPGRAGAAKASRHSRRLRAELRSAVGQRPRHHRRLRVRGRGSRRRRQRRARTTRRRR